MASNRPVAINYFTTIYWKIALMTYSIAFLTRNGKDFSLAGKTITLSGIIVGLVAIYNKLHLLLLGFHPLPQILNLSGPF